MNALPTRIACGWNRLHEAVKLSLIFAWSLGWGLLIMKVFL